MGPMEATTTCLKKYGTTSGRAMRSEFWWFWLVHIMVPFILITMPIVIQANHNLGMFLFYSGIAFYLITIPPTYCAVVRRFHDTGRPGKHSILFIIAVVIVALDVLVIVGFVTYSLTINTFSDPSPILYIFPVLALIDAFIFWILFIFVLAPLSLVALILFGINAAKLSDKSQSGHNKYGPNPHEVPS